MRRRISETWSGGIDETKNKAIMHYFRRCDMQTRKGCTSNRWVHGFIGAVDGKDDDFTTTNAIASSLSATSILGPGNKTDITLLYENLNGDMIMIRKTPSTGSLWRDISPELRSAAPDAILRSPFSSGSIMAGRSEIIVTKPKIPSSYPTYEESCIITYQDGTFTSGKRLLVPGTYRFLPNANDGGTYLLSIDKPGGMISLQDIDTLKEWRYTGLNGQFPFSNAAALFTDRSGTLIVYYQTNNLSIAEQIWDLNLGGWINGTWIDYDS